MDYVDVHDFKNLYKVNPKGQVYGLKRGKLLKTVSDEGYYSPKVVLSGGKKRRLAYIRELVATAFIPNPDNLPYIIHKDGDLQNCEASNLEWSATKK